MAILVVEFLREGCKIRKVFDRSLVESGPRNSFVVVVVVVRVKCFVPFAQILEYFVMF
jgi:hypothetical protein